jgi:hypothetical protein
LVISSRRYMARLTAGWNGGSAQNALVLESGG